MNIREHSFFQIGKIKPPKGNAKSNSNTFCSPYLVYSSFDDMNTLVASIYNALKETNKQILESEFSPQAYASQVNSLVSMYHHIFDSHNAIYSSEKECAKELISLTQATSDVVISANNRGNTFGNLYYCIDALQTAVGKLDKPLVTSIDNGNKYADFYVGMTEAERQRLKKTTKDFILLIKKLDDLKILTINAFDLTSYQVLKEPFYKLNGVLTDLMTQYDKIDNQWNGELSKFLQFKDYKGYDYLSYVKECNNQNIDKLDKIVNFDLKVPRVLGEEGLLATSTLANHYALRKLNNCK